MKDNEVIRENVKEGEFFKLKGDSRTNYAYQVQECWDGIMSVKCNGGVMDKPYSEWERVSDTRNCKYVCNASYFEDNRTTIN